MPVYFQATKKTSASVIDIYFQLENSFINKRSRILVTGFVAVVSGLYTQRQGAGQMESSKKVFAMQS